MKKLFMICNAHIDPVWLWKRQDGIAAVLSTFRSAAALLEKYDFIFCHNESFTYEMTEKYDPVLFKKIQDLHRRGKWQIIGGWDIQPDCNMPSGESVLRHIEKGRKYFWDKFQVIPRVATNFDSFGHSDGLIQILQQCGYEGYIICRPSPEGSNIPENFIWKKNGWEIKVARPNDHYNSLRGQARNKAEKLIKDNSQELKLMLWGVGNHGGGPSEKDLKDLKDLSESSVVDIFYAVPEDYFRENIFSKEVTGSLNPCMPGCYTVQSAVKKKHRQLENEYYFTEKICSQANIVSGADYPAQNLKKALDELLFSQFHDALPGSAVKAVEDQIICGMDYALHILEAKKYDAFCALASSAKKADKGEYPFFVYNPMPYQVKTTVGLDFILENQNYGDQYIDLDVFVNGNRVQSQIVKEKSNINLDWAKRVMVECVLPPMSLSRISVYERPVDHKPVIRQNFGNSYVFDNGIVRAELNALTGLLTGVWYRGELVLTKNSGRIDVIGDNADPWAMGYSQRYQLGESIGSFTLIEKSSIGDYIQWKSSSGRNVRIVEDGDVLTRIEAIFSYKKADAIVCYTFYKHFNYFDIDVRMNNNNFDVTYKLTLGLAEECKLFGESMFGQEELSQSGCELVSHRWVRCEGKKNAVNVYNSGTYGFSFKCGVLSMNLLRSAAYSAHPLTGRDLLFEDRVIERIDCGVRTFNFRIELCEAENSLAKALNGAELFNSPPYAENFWPDGTRDNISNSLLELDNKKVELCSFRKTDNGYCMRLYNGSDAEASVKVVCKVLKIEKSLHLQPFTFGTYILRENKIEVTDPAFCKTEESV